MEGKGGLSSCFSNILGIKTLERMRMTGKWKSMRTKIKCVEKRIENRKRLLV